MRRLMFTLIVLLSASPTLAQVIRVPASAVNEAGVVSKTLTPATNDGAALGTTALSFSDLFLASGGVINWASGDVTFTHSSHAVTLGGGSLLFTDNSYDIGASGATRPRDFFLARNATIGGTTSFGGNVISNLLFTDNSYDIGASGATRPRHLFLSANATVGGTLTRVGEETASASATLDTTSGNAFRIVMSTPGTVTATPANGGALANATTYYIAVTAVDPIGGETLTSAQSTCLTANPNLTCSTSWTAITGANSYWVYYGTTSALGKRYTTTTASYSLAADAGAAQAVPSAGSAYRTNFGGATANWLALASTTTVNGLGTTSTDGINIQNTTGALVGTTVQISPRIRQTGYGWDTDDAVSRPAQFFTEVLPVSAATVSGTWKLGWMDPTTNAITYPMMMTNLGGLTTVGGYVSGGDILVPAANYIYWTSRSLFNSPADGQLNLSKSGLTIGTGLDFATDSLLKVRTRAQTGDASISALDVGVSGQVLARESFKQPHMVREEDFTTKVLTDGGVNVVLGSPSGIVQYREELEKTASSWVESATGGLDITADNTIDNEGVEIYLGDGADTTTGWILTGTDTACFSVNFTIALIAGTDQFVIGWRQNEVWASDNVYTGYDDWSVVGINNVDGSIFSLGEVAHAGTLSDDSGVNAANADVRTLKSCISAVRVPTAFYTANGGTTFTAITMTNSGTAKTTGEKMNPFISYLQAGGAVDAGIKINFWEITRQ